jgi:type IV secretory pathway VirB10-like protein
MELNTNHGTDFRSMLEISEDKSDVFTEESPEQNVQTKPSEEPSVSPSLFATRASALKGQTASRNKVLLIAGGLIAAILFFVMTALMGNGRRQTRSRAISPHEPQQAEASKGSITPLMDTVHNPSPTNPSGQLSPADISRMRASNGSAVPGNSVSAPKSETAANLGSIPPFADTQQHWEEPKPYEEGQTTPTPQTQQQQNALKETSLVFVKSPVQPSVAIANSSQVATETPVLDLTPGTRIEAKLETQVSSAMQAPVVAVVEYTYAIGDRVVIPAGASVYGQLQQADRSGFVNIKFNEIQLVDGTRAKIEAIGTGLDLGPIKGTVYGKNTGRNFLVRTASGIGSVAAMIVGNNTSSSFSEGDLIRQRIAENVGNAGDSELMNMAVTNRIIVSVPADTKIYVVFTKREQNTATLRRVATTAP